MCSSAKQLVQQHDVYERLPYYHPPRSRPVTFEGPSGGGFTASYRDGEQHALTTVDYHYYTENTANTSINTTNGGAVDQNLGPYIDRQQANSCDGGRSMLKTTIEYKQQRNRLANLPTHNNEPKPFVRRSDGEILTRGGHNNRTLSASSGVGQHYAPQAGFNNSERNHYDNNQSGGGVHFSACASASAGSNQGQLHAPRLLLNDQPAANYCNYPTSTVHKSMLKSRSRASSEERQGQYSAQQASADRGLCDSTNSGKLQTDTRQVRQMFGGGACLSEQRNLGPGARGPQGGAVSPEANFNDENYEQRQHQMPLPLPLPSSAERRRATGADGPNNSGGGVRSSGSRNKTTGTGQSEASGPTVAAAAASNSGSGRGSRGSSFSGGRCSRGGLVPDDRRDEYMWNRQLERSSIAHQTYRTLPIVWPKPKARHDLATGTYMRFSHDPTWELANQSRPSSSLGGHFLGSDVGPAVGVGSRSGNKDHHERRIQEAIRGPAMESSRFTETAASERQNESRQDDYPNPAFNYRQYIESLRDPPKH